ncbi:lysoplasmalogenase [Ferrovibrio sp.]|uniref:lysoplasmalogenase n=1 Tax=Ferrovibrio sp. TaxID=1917215 RepID=UPI00311FC81B
MNNAARRYPSGAPRWFVRPVRAARGLGGGYIGPPWLLLPVWLAAAVKGAVCPLLALALWRSRNGDADARRLGLALLLSAAGDVFLAVDPAGLFVAGLGSFLLAHLIYLWQFLRHRPRPLALPGPRLLAMAAIVVAVAGMLAVLLPGLGALAGPVVAYIGAITAMALAAALLPGRGLVLSGAVLFMLSDSLIALNKFVAPVPAAGAAIWISYVAAQLLIVLGWRGERRIA